MFIDAFVNAFKTSLACLLGFLIAHYLHFPSSQWIIITIVVVMTAQIHFGSALQKAYLRFIGTLIGVGIAALTLHFYKANTIIVVDGIIMFSAFLFCLLGALSPALGQAMTLGSVTVPIILLSANANLTTAYLRAGEIILGILIALFVNAVVFPIHAKHKFEKLLLKNMKTLTDYYVAAAHHDFKKCAYYEKHMMENFARAEQLLDDAKREPGVKEQHYRDLLLHQKRLFRGISLLEYFSAANLHVFIERELDILLRLAGRS